MMDDLVTEVRSREEIIENLSSKLNINEQRQREYKIVFGSVGQLEEKLKKMDQLYSDKLRACFDHYSRTISIVNLENQRINLISERLKESQISSSKASSNLSTIFTTLESQINCFEKFFNKFSAVSDLNYVVEAYLKSKQEAKKGINRVIYLEELAKFKEQSKQNSPTDRLKSAYVDKMETMKKRFQGLQKAATDTQLNPIASNNQTNSKNLIRSSQRKFNFKQDNITESGASLQKAVGYRIEATPGRQSNQGSRSSFRLSQVKSHSTLKPNVSTK
jgi:hypothetical protein